MKHCWHDMATNQREYNYKCCWCGIEKESYTSDEGHGTALGEIKVFVNRSEQVCPKRSIDGRRK